MFAGGMANGSTKGSGGHLSNYSNGDVKSNGGGDHSDHDDCEYGTCVIHYIK